MRILLFSVLFLIGTSTVGRNTTDKQEGDDKFNYVVSTATGDLNNDGLEDKVIVNQDTLDGKGPYKLSIYFQLPDDGYKLVLVTEKVIMPQYPNGKGGYINGPFFDEISIDYGTLIISNSLIRGNFEYRFKYKEGSFELINYHFVSSDGVGQMVTIDFDLIKGFQSKEVVNYETDEVISADTTNKIITPLPKLQDFEPMTNEWEWD